MTQTVLVTGSNRGIGLEMSRQYAQEGWNVLACCRNPQQANELKRIADSFSSRVTLHQLDVAHADQIRALANELKGQSIDILVNNAGLRGLSENFGEADESVWMDVLKVNTIAPLKVVEALVENVARSREKVIATVSSDMGSIHKNVGGRDYIYRSSKAAVNAVMKTLSIDLKDLKIIVVMVHPGWVQTDMGGRGAPLSVQESVKGMRTVLASLKLKNTGRFYAYDGREIPW